MPASAADPVKNETKIDIAKIELKKRGKAEHWLARLLFELCTRPKVSVDEDAGVAEYSVASLSSLLTILDEYSANGRNLSPSSVILAGRIQERRVVDDLYFLEFECNQMRLFSF